MSNYVELPSINCIYFKESETIYTLEGRKPIFTSGTKLENIDDLWVKQLSKEDKKLIEKDLKKFKKI